jgi:hypothetical protein
MNKQYGGVERLAVCSGMSYGLVPMAPALPFSLCFLDCMQFRHLVALLFAWWFDGVVWG